MACLGHSSVSAQSGFTGSPFRRTLSLRGASRRFVDLHAAQRRRHWRTTAVLDDFEYPTDGPLEPCKPRFHREHFESTGPSVITSQDLGQQQKPRRFRRKYKPASPPEALTGAAISAVCAGGLWQGVQEAAAFVSTNPPAHDLPHHLTSSVNSFLLSMVWAFGGLAVSMFGVASIGLSLLALQTAQKQKSTS